MKVGTLSKGDAIGYDDSSVVLAPYRRENMMLRLPLALVSMMLGVVLAAGSAYAQAEGPPPGERGGRGMRQPGGPGGFGMPGAGPSALLRLEQVQKELSLTDEQKDKVKALLKEVAGGMRGQIPNWGDLTDEERRAKRDEIRKQAAEKMEKFEKQLAEILKPEQLERLHQIRLQFSLQTEGGAAIGGRKRPNRSGSATNSARSSRRSASRCRSRLARSAVRCGTFRPSNGRPSSGKRGRRSLKP